MALGLGKPEPGALIFSHPTVRRFRQTTCPGTAPGMSVGIVTARDVSRSATTHASALIASGLDVGGRSPAAGDGSPVVTLRVYGHLFASSDSGRCSCY